MPSDAVDLLDENKYGMINVTGLRRPEADMYTPERGGVDGSFFSGMSVKSRTITLELDAQNDLQMMKLYKLLPYKQPRRFYAVTDAGTFWIDGYAQGIVGDETGCEIKTLEIPIFCEYPWFRSFEMHEQVLTYDGGYKATMSHDGDVEAGIILFVKNASGDNLAALNSVGISDEGSSKAVNVSTTGGETEEGKLQIYPSMEGRGTLILNTTPAAHEYASLGLRFDVQQKEYLSVLKVTTDWPTIDPYDGVTVNIAGDPLSNYPDDFEVRVAWYDTWTGI